jgi:hypothetical protein
LFSGTIHLTFYTHHIHGAPCKAKNFNVVCIYKLSCGTVVCKHFASYQGCPNYRWDLIRYAKGKLLCNFHIYVIYKCGRGPRNTTWCAKRPAHRGLEVSGSNLGGTPTILTVFFHGKCCNCTTIGPRLLFPHPCQLIVYRRMFWTSQPKSLNK